MMIAFNKAKRIKCKTEDRWLKVRVNLQNNLQENVQDNLKEDIQDSVQCSVQDKMQDNSSEGKATTGQLVGREELVAAYWAEL